jgi:inner membrane protein COX18
MSLALSFARKGVLSSGLTRPRILRSPYAIPRRMPSRGMATVTNISADVLSSFHHLLCSLHDGGLSWVFAIPAATIIARLTLGLFFQLPVHSINWKRMAIGPYRSAHERIMAGTSFLANVEEWSLKRMRLTTWNKRVAARYGLRDWQIRLSLVLPFLQIIPWLAFVETIRTMIGTRTGLLGMVLGRSHDKNELISSQVGDVLQAPVQDAMASSPLIAKWIEPSMAHEGALWFQDLTVADPTLILPFMVSSITFINIWKNRTVLKETPFQWHSGRRLIGLYTSRALLFLPAIMFPMISAFPSGILLCWGTSAATVMGINALLHFLRPLPRYPEPFRRGLHRIVSQDEWLLEGQKSPPMSRTASSRGGRI